jgi:2-dehydropantoate 2-reductase
MKIAVMATGGVGGYFGARLAAAGEEVHFIARGAHLDAIRRDGLKVESALGDVHVENASVADDPASIGPADVVLFAVKLWDTETAGEACKPLVGDATAVIMLQNGVDGVARLAPILGEDAVIGGVAYISAFIESPGTIRHHGNFARLQFEDKLGLKLFCDACGRAGFDAEMPADIELAQWQKFVFLVGLSGATAVTRRSIGPIIADAECRRLLRSLMEETAAVGRARGVALPENFAEDRMAYAGGLPPDMKASTLDDLERGKRLEVDWLSGEVSRLGAELGVATPANDAVYAALKLHRDGAA